MSIIRVVKDKFSKEEFLAAFEKYGYVVVENVFSKEFCTKIKSELSVAIDKEAAFHGTTEYKDYGMLLACPIYGGAFLEVVDHRELMLPFDWVLGETCIIWVYTSSSQPPHGANYSKRVHVDRPHFTPGFTEAMGCLIMLDDFTEDNGATWVLPGSHAIKEPPDEDFFYKNAIRITGSKGSVLYFHLRLWHAGGQNQTSDWRHALGIGMIRPYIKQRIDLPRALANTDISGVSDFGLQKLGFFSQPPSSLEEYYAAPEKRQYRQRSEWSTPD